MAVLKDLIVHGNSRFINGASFNKLKADDLAAEQGYFNKLVAVNGDISNLNVDDLTAQNATVIGLLDVKGELHTNSWTNANIATIDGSFYITPTVSCASGTFAYDGTNITVTAASGSSFGVDSLYTYTTSGTVTTYSSWAQYSRVLLTGEVQLSGSNEWQPLGTIRGQIVSSSTSVIKINNLSDSQGTTPIATLTDLGSTNISGASFRKVKVSLYERASNSTSFYPIGIYMTALGAKGKTFIDIYGGGDAKGSVVTGGIDSGAMAKPVLRIGNLGGLPKVANQTPSGWGIYTSNGFFEGAIVAKEGYIGNTGGYWIIGGGQTSGSTFLRSAPTGPTTVSATSTAGTYLGTDGFLNTASSTTYAQITNGVLTAQGAVIKGALTATSLATGTKTGSTSGNGVFIDSSGNIYVGNGSTNKFTVTSAGVLTATDAKLNNLTLYDSSGNTALGSFSASSGNATITLGQTSSGKFNVLITDTAVNSKGPGILLRQGTNVLNEITASGMKLYLPTDQTNTIAEFGETSYIGKHNNTQSYLKMDYHSLQMIDKEGNSYFYVSDLRDTNGTTQIEMVLTSDGVSRMYQLIPPATNNTYTVTVSNNSGGTITKNTGYIQFSSAPTAGATISATYTSTDRLAKAYTIGLRKSDTPITAGSFAQGHMVEASGICSHAEGYSTTASGMFAHSEGYLTKATSYYSHAEGLSTSASLSSCHAEGQNSTASGIASHAEGAGTVASGNSSHAEGNSTTASGDGTHTEGIHTTASGNFSHAEGWYTTASGGSSHAEGSNCIASGAASHAGGLQTRATVSYQTTIGQYNDTGDYAFIIGNGTSDDSRSNALTVDWNGKMTIGSRMVTSAPSSEQIIDRIDIIPVYHTGGPWHIKSGDTSSIASLLIGYGGTNLLRMDHNGNVAIKGMAGQVVMFAGSTAPTGWLICNGAAVSRTTYATLFAVIGTTYGAGDGSTTFNLPNLQGRVAIGVSSSHAIASTGGAETVTLTAAQSGVPAHKHSPASLSFCVVEALSGDNTQRSQVATSSSSGKYAITAKSSSASYLTSVAATANNTTANATSAHTNMQPFITLNYIICTGKI